LRKPAHRCLPEAIQRGNKGNKKKNNPVHEAKVNAFSWQIGCQKPRSYYFQLDGILTGM
jgi:hypothetical protein